MVSRLSVEKIREKGISFERKGKVLSVTSSDDDLEESSIPSGFYSSLRTSLMPLICFLSLKALKLVFAVQLGLVFSHTENYPDEVLLLDVKNIRGIHVSDLTILKENLEQDDWLSEHYGQDDGADYAEEETAKENEILFLITGNCSTGEPVTLETFVAWRERYEAELALERAKLMPESALTAPKEKKLTGRQWFESGKARGTVVAADQESLRRKMMKTLTLKTMTLKINDDEEDMLEHYLVNLMQGPEAREALHNNF
ncbi:hypothetical protein Bca52824_011273 [Brassica carinata]|uniref:Uncharacterized protein n=1 Tax=Brassica carinata TaxID=52824 RepID=A0A8X7WGV2_BRACI|nr:hypothetical protein Bca52824_011273 [Brassica carinata]